MFDRVDWSFLLRTLSIGFGDSFVKWIRLLYANPRGAVVVNGHISPFFSSFRGARLGCPLFPLLYVSGIEVLVYNVRALPAIRGIAFSTFKIKLVEILPVCRDSN